MALTKVTSGLISADASSVDLNIDAGTLYIDATNNRVGIGTTSPQTDLNIVNSSGATLDINTNSGAADSKILLHEGTSASPANGASIRYDGAANLFKIGVGSSVDTTRLSIDRTTGDISFYEDTGTTAKLFWDASAESLGIGTTSPARLLDVFGGDVIFSRSGATHQILFGDAAARYFAIETPAGAANFKIRNITNSVDIMTFAQAGNVGIGTNSPSRKLHVNSGIEGISAGIAGTTYGIRFDNGGTFSSGMSTIHGVDSSFTSSYQPIRLNGSDVRFATGNNERMRIDGSGTVLIGKTTTSSSVEGIILSSNDFVQATRSGGTCLSANRKDSTGTIQNFEYNGGTVGTISVTASSTSYNTSSDGRLKDITGSARGLEVINALNPVAFNWKESGQADEGLIAQEVEQIVPNVVSKESEEDYYTMDYSKLVTHLVAGMKEQQVLIEQLQAEVALLKGE